MPDDEQSVSEHLIEYMCGGGISWEPNTYAVGDEQLDQSGFDLRGDIVHLLLKCRESIQNLGPEGVRTADEFVNQNRSRVEKWLDAHYVMESLGDIHSKVERTLRLSAIGAAETPSAQTNHYFAECNRCYIHGLVLSAVAMARAALEQSLKERFAGLGDLESERLTLGSLIERAAQQNVVLSPDLTNMARELNRKCNQAMHNRPPRDENAALDILVGIRFLIMKLFSDQ